MDIFPQIGSIRKQLRHYRRKIEQLIPPEWRLSWQFYQIHGYWPDIKSPRSFSEKILHRSLRANARDSHILSNKFLARDYVSSAGFGHLLPELFLHTATPEEIKFDKLPQKFVVKATHGSGWNIIVHDKFTLSEESVKATCRGWMKSQYADKFSELHYADIAAGIIIEEFLDGGNGMPPTDYKFLIFHGKCELIQIDRNRFSNHTKAFYRPDWSVSDFEITDRPNRLEPRPRRLDDMIKIAEKLATPYDFVRVDLYQLTEDRIVFGEFTFTPGAGMQRFKPNKDADFRFGTLWHLNR